MDGSNLEIPDFKGPTPGHVQKAIDREDGKAETLGNEQRILAKDLASQKLSYRSAKRLLVPVNETKLRHQRLAKQIRSEFEVK